jgi:hypothetical protein
MKLTHQVFLQLPHGSRMWAASTTSLEEARQCVARFSSVSSGSIYVILDVRTGRFVDPTESAGTSASAIGRLLLAPVKLPSLDQLHQMAQSLQRSLRELLL